MFLSSIRIFVKKLLVKLGVMKPHPMQQYLDMLETILKTGKRRPNRTGQDTLFVPSYALKFHMADGFPAPTFKKFAFKAARGELFGFFRGYTSAAQFREIGCKVWDANANVTPSWLSNKNRKGEDDIGRSYPAQWTDWRDWREVSSQQDCDELIAEGFELRSHDPAKNIWVLRKGINQLEVALNTIMTNPTDRRIIVNGWRPDEHGFCPVPACHVLYQFLPDIESKTLHMCLYQRSFDTALAFNISIGAMMLEIMARLAGYSAGQMTHFIGDAHVYVSHIEGVKEMLKREQFKQPTLDLGDIRPLSSVDEIPGIFARLDHEQVTMKGYQSHPAIKLDMAA